MTTGMQQRVTPSMILRVSWLDAPLKTVTLYAGSMLEMMMPGYMPSTPKKVTVMMNNALKNHAPSRLSAQIITRTVSREATARIGKMSSVGCSA